MTVPPELVALKGEGEALGFQYGTDFFVWRVPGDVSSEVIIFGMDGQGYTVTYSDMGHDRRLYRSASFGDAKARFFAEVARLAGPRGRGPLAGQPRRSRWEGMTPVEVYEAMQAEGLFPGVVWPGDTEAVTGGPAGAPTPPRPMDAVDSTDGLREPRISATKGLLDSGPDLAARPGRDGVEWYAPTREEQIATPLQRGDRDAHGNITDAARERRRAIAEAAVRLRALPAGTSVGAGDAGVTRTDVGFVVDLPDGTRQWRDDDWQLHRDGAPAVEHPGGAASWWRHGRLDRADGPAVTGDRTEWWVDGRRHRADGPAAEGAGAPTEWWLDGERYRTDGPAVTWPDGKREWWRHGQRHRADGPAVEKPDGSQEWWVDGEIHREDGPALVSATGARQWLRHGRKHRADGPALEGPGTDPAWAYWLDGEHVTRDAVERRRTWFGRRTR